MGEYGNTRKRNNETCFDWLQVPVNVGGWKRTGCAYKTAVVESWGYVLVGWSLPLGVFRDGDAMFWLGDKCVIKAHNVEVDVSQRFSFVKV